MRVAPLFVCSVDPLAPSGGMGVSGRATRTQPRGSVRAAVPPGMSFEPGDTVQIGERWF